MRRPAVALAALAVAAGLVVTAAPAQAWFHCGTPQAEPDCPATTTAAPATTTTRAATTTSSAAPATTTTRPATTTSTTEPPAATLIPPVVVTAAPAPATTVHKAPAATGSGPLLPNTGADIGLGVLLAGFILVAGFILIVASRRRKHPSAEVDE